MKDDLLKKYNIVSMNDLLLNFEEVHKENQKLILKSLKYLQKINKL